MKSALQSCVALGAALLAVPVSGCSSESTPGAPSGDAGMSCADDALGAGAVNPYGVAYPCDGIGIHARKGPIKGNRIQDFQFQGYPGGDVSKGLQTISLADFYDPQGTLGFKLLHVGMAAAWCVPCNEETDATVPLIAGFTTQGVVFAEALGEGTTTGTAATPADLTMWIANHKTNFTQMLDPEYANLGTFFDAAQLPWNAIIDARSMEILQDGVGYSGSLQNDLSPWISWVNSSPPSYPAP